MALQIGDSVTLTISDIAFGGEGVARLNDFVVFVPFVIAGETVEAEITEVKKRFARAKLVRVIEASAHRVKPECPHFAACGGCQYQHMEYGEQLRIKRKQIADLFERVGGFCNDVIAPVEGCPRPYGYRNRIMIRSQWNKPEQKLNIGFIRWDCGLVEDIEICPISEPALNEQIRHVRAHPPAKGGIKIVLRIPPEGWEVPASSFFQNNFFQLPKLIETVRTFLKSAGSEHLIDLFCGVGFFGIELAGDVKSFCGVEYDKLAVGAARRNADTRGITNGEFIAASAEEAFRELTRRFDSGRTTILIDPPRKGCWPELLRLLREYRPRQVIYVSCHPATMARDLNVLCGDAVFKLVQVVPLDMFPQTQHVECVADLRGALQ